MTTNFSTMSSGVYQIVNLIDPAKFYIGSAVNLRKRRSHHWSSLRHGRHSNNHLQHAWDLYGSDAFDFEPLIICGPEEAVVIEQGLLDKLHPHYNISKDAQVGLPSALGLKRSKETRQRMSGVRKGMKLSDEHRRNISRAKRGG